MYTEITMKIADLWNLLYRQPVAELFPDGWFFQAGEFLFGVNPHKQPLRLAPEDCMQIEAPPYTVVVWRDGWLVALADPLGGSTIGGEEIEDEIIAALDRLIESAQNRAGENKAMLDAER